MRKMLEQINAAPLTPELSKVCSGRSPISPLKKRQDVTGRIMAIIEVLEAGTHGRHRAILGLAINFRLLALARLMLTAEMSAFRANGYDAPDLLQDDLLHALVEMPLTIQHGDFAFDPEAFRDRLLTLARPAGSA